MADKGELLREVMAILRQFEACRSTVIAPGTNLLVEADLDSFSMLELVDILKNAYDIEFLAPPYSVDDLRSPESIVTAILKHQSEKSGDK